MAERLRTVPATRMKAKREHRVPLSDRSLAILTRARELAAGRPLVFLSCSSEKPLSKLVFLMLLQRMELAITAHGFHSSFQDWPSARKFAAGNGRNGARARCRESRQRMRAASCWSAIGT